MPNTSASEKNNSFIYIIGGLLVLAAFFIGMLFTKVQYLEKSNKPSAPSNNQGQAVAPPTEAVGEVPKITDDDHIKGDKNARIALIEYSDMECPFCKRFHSTAQQAVDDYKGQVKWVYRHFPLSIHLNAQKEAEASECAWELGGNDGFWKYIDIIYERTGAGGTGFALDSLVPLAKEIGLDQTKFKQCLDNGKYVQKVKDQMDGGAKAGVNGTPGNIIIDTKTNKMRAIPGAVPFEQIKSVIDEMLKA